MATSGDDPRRPPFKAGDYEARVLFGGAFHPFHVGHAAILDRLVRLPALLRLVILPSANPPHKSLAESDSALRRQVLESHLAGLHGPARVELDRYELEHPLATHYTVDALRRLGASEADPWGLVIGLDSFRDLPSWKDWPDVLRLSRPWVAPRFADEAERAAFRRAFPDEAPAFLSAPEDFFQMDWAFGGAGAERARAACKRPPLVLNLATPIAASRELRAGLVSGEAAAANEPRLAEAARAHGAYLAQFKTGG